MPPSQNHIHNLHAKYAHGWVAMCIASHAYPVSSVYRSMLCTGARPRNHHPPPTHPWWVGLGWARQWLWHAATSGHRLTKPPHKHAMPLRCSSIRTIAVEKRCQLTSFNKPFLGSVTRANKYAPKLLPAAICCLFVFVCIYRFGSRPACICRP